LIDDSEISEDRIVEILSSFMCAQDKDIESFLHDRAIEFERLSKSRTYLIMDEEELASWEDYKVYGYITIALKILSIPESSSNRFRKELDGFSAKIHGEPISEFPCYLIGQLARNSDVEKNALSGEKLLQLSFDIIESAAETVGGRYLMIECHDNQKLINFYSSNGFNEIASIPDNVQPMVQMIRKIF